MRHHPYDTCAVCVMFLSEIEKCQYNNQSDQQYYYFNIECMVKRLTNRLQV